MKQNNKLKVATGLIALLISPAWILGAGGTQSRVQVAIAPILRMEVQQAPLSFEFAEGDYDLEAGTARQASGGQTTVRVLANHGWHVQVQADAEAFSHTPAQPGGPVAAKPASDLRARRAGDAGFVPLSSEKQVVASGAAGGFAANTFAVEYELASDLAGDLPGDYTLTVTYSVIPQ